MKSTSLDFDLLIERGEWSYRAQVLTSPAGEASVGFSLPFSNAELAAFLDHESRSLSAALLEKFGARLFRVVFRDAVGSCLRRSADLAADQGARLRLRLRLHDVPELANLPWEYLYDPRNQRFLALENALVRYVALPTEAPAPLAVTLPLRILVVLANPSDDPALEVEREWAKFQEALGHLQAQGLVKVERLGARGALEERLRQGEFHILHLIGHGLGACKEGAASGTDLPFALEKMLLPQSLRLLFAAIPEGLVSASEPVTHTAQRLVAQGLSSVLAMQFAMTDQAAITLTYEFYRALVNGAVVDAALTQARQAIFTRQLQASAEARTLATSDWRATSWATPLLFSQTPDGCLFDITAPSNKLFSDKPPFKGLSPFDEQDAELFFGREKLIEQLVAHLAEHNFLAIVGPPRSGKSSLVCAGLIPALKRSSDNWLVRIMTPTADPLEALAIGLTRDVESVLVTDTLIDELARNPRHLHLYVRQLLNQNRFLLVIDQFEQLFTLCHSSEKRQAFVDNLLNAVSRQTIVLVISLRTEFLAHCTQFEKLRWALEGQQKYIAPMTREQLRRAIEGPAEQASWTFETGLVELLLEDVATEATSLPLLSHALLETWQRRRGRTLTLAGYLATQSAQRLNWPLSTATQKKMILK